MKHIPPRRVRPRPKGADCGPQVRSAQAPRILVAEDHPVNRAVIACQLRHLGCLPTLVEDGSQALDALARTRYDLLLTDCRMPVLDGLALARAIRGGEAGIDPRLPIVALAGTASQASQYACAAAGMDGYLAKPVRVSELQRELARHLPGDTPAPASPGTSSEQRRARRLAEAFGSARQALRVLQPLLDTSRTDLAALDAALQSGDRPRQRELLHRLSGALALLDAQDTASARPARAPRDPSRHRDVLARRVEGLQRLLVRLHARRPLRRPT